MLTVWWEHWPVVAAGVIDAPVIVLRANRVVACSPGATADGVAVGQRRRIAQQRCPGATLLDHDPDRDARAFEPVVRAVGEFTPRLESVEPGWLCVESRGPSRYFGGDDALAEKIVATVTGAAGRLDGALAGTTAHLGVGIADGRFAAAVAARLAVGRGQPVVVDPAASAGFLAPLPVAWLRETGEADAELVGLLTRLGLATLGDVAALREVDVAARFGPPGAHLHRLACGDDDRPSLAKEPPAQRRVERLFDDPVMQLDPLVFVGKQLADELAAALDLGGLTCVRIVVIAETDHGERTERVWYRGNGFSAAAIVDRVRWQLDGWVAQPGGLSAGVVMLRLDPVELRPAGGEQLRLWGGISASDERAVRAIARLAGIVGESAVQVPAWQGGRLPGDRYRWIPAATTDLADADDTAGRLRPVQGKPVVKRSRRGSRKPATPVEPPPPWPGSLPAPSPALVEGVAAIVTDLAGAAVTVSGRGELSAPPASLTVEGRAPQQVTAWAGPWPVDERWWDEQRHRRLARFQFVTADGAAHLVAVEKRSWKVLATYA